MKTFISFVYAVIFLAVLSGIVQIDANPPTPRITNDMGIGLATNLDRETQMALEAVRKSGKICGLVGIQCFTEQEVVAAIAAVPACGEGTFDCRCKTNDGRRQMWKEKVDSGIDIMTADAKVYHACKPRTFEHYLTKQ